jgi:cobalt-zinc-cadmium efflux system membrane fusion protein
VWRECVWPIFMLFSFSGPCSSEGTLRRLECPGIGPATQQAATDAALFSVDHPEQFPLATATEHPTTSELVVTGTVTPDVSRNVPVVSLASGTRHGDHARLGDTVQKGQLLMTIRSDDVSGGYSNYKMAVADEVLARDSI